jgi:ribosomal protein L40E
MENLCKNCGQPFQPDAKFCRKCGANLLEIQKSEGLNKIIVSTGDIKRDYDVLRPIHLFHHSLTNKERFGEKNISTDDVIDYIIEEMKEEAIEEGGDAILFLRVDFEQMQLGGSQYFVYGTLVKFK